MPSDVPLVVLFHVPPEQRPLSRFLFLFIALLPSFLTFVTLSPSFLSLMLFFLFCTCVSLFLSCHHPAFFSFALSSKLPGDACEPGVTLMEVLLLVRGPLLTEKLGCGKGGKKMRQKECGYFGSGQDKIEKMFVV